MVSKLNEKVNERMNDLQFMMESNFHLTNPVLVELHINSITKFWNILTEEDRDYIHGCQYAVEQKIEWKIDE